MNCSFFQAGEQLEAVTDADTAGSMPAARATLTEMAPTWNDDELIRELLRARTE
jgi:hypothetical protein